MSEPKVTILSGDDVRKRYSGDLRFSFAADEAFKTINKGKDFSVVLIEDDSFFGGIGRNESIIFNCNTALKKAFPNYRSAKFVSFVDKSELHKNRLYISCRLIK